MIVVDASACVHALQAERPDPDLVRTLQKAGSLHAPTLLDIEFLSALRGLVMSGKLPIDRADEARMDFSDLPLVRYPIEKLADRIWALRDNLTVYDAAYIALAEALGCTLVTTDAKLRSACGHRAEVEVYPLTPSR
ncbi:type II toxin-antitoxin system VapC family toxin [Nonomuraea sp. NPDC004186]|uniref:type II toxin-antitoxin system VapC family toxin n=1 Tax=Nonomuraea sp. NPDC049625 TaxID=3155775 RepID=UPI003442605F